MWRKGPHHNLPAEGATDVGEEDQKHAESKPAYMNLRKRCPKVFPLEIRSGRAAINKGGSQDGPQDDKNNRDWPAGPSAVYATCSMIGPIQQKP